MKVALQVAQLGLAASGRLAELDLNPLKVLATGKGCVAVVGVADASTGTERVVAIVELRDPRGADTAMLLDRINMVRAKA